MTNSISKMARHLLSAAAAVAVLTTTSAIAADLPVKTAAAPVELPLWSAFYIGVHGGWGQGRSRVEDPRFDMVYQPLTSPRKARLRAPRSAPTGSSELVWSPVPNS